MKFKIVGFKEINEDRVLLDCLSTEETTNHVGDTVEKVFCNSSMFNSIDDIVGTEVNIYRFKPNYFPIVKLVRG